MDVVKQLVIVAIALQVFELFMSTFAAKFSLFDWKVLGQEHSRSKGLNSLLHFLFQKYGYRLICVVHLLTLFAWWFYPQAVWLLIFFHWLHSVRFRGIVYGGSDQLLFFILLAFALRLEPLAIAGLSTLSYAVAGLAKISSATWRSGRALALFHSQKWNHFPVLKIILSWVIIIFEMTFFVALMDPRCAIVYLAIGFLFHLENLRALGLRSFFFVWISTYPAIFWCSLFAPVRF